MTNLRNAIIASSLFAVFSALAQTVPPAEERDAAMPQAQTSETPATPAALPAEPPAGDRDAVMPQAQTSETPVTQDTSPKPPSEGKQSETSTTRTSQFKTVDRLELEGTAITGNRELPKVLYIVPWKKSGLGDMIGRPANSLLDEVLAPVDRDVFKRQTEYFTTLNSDATAPAPQPGPATAPPER